MSTPLQERFDKFWINYPKKRNKGSAKKIWLRIKPSEELLQKMIAKIREAEKSKDWRKDNGQFIPYPATWLNGECWEDEYDKPKPTVEQMLAMQPKIIPRKETPQERELIDKMKDLAKPPFNWKNRSQVNKMRTEMKKLQKQYDDLRSAPKKLGDLIEDAKK